ncbi:assimilatory sulfite reductase (NADPH) hemoprotein subunit [Bacillus norwichensis]|uniref:Sulfite reductase [NADPH] hemoprotein beta-component n=1 Tax=Bacillus norwichensis TaxID=2762217 RepID=A0ABR8VIE7_9BACI|nr:assimilatory sulfite reductase (NADPH) hemoprotein subunit [Bacillus norwichensis]MBD8004527.1 assimilatory sulfite reductase (NADPH) hemoprotein subunit [Bacillus norwichensis]
MSKTKLVPSQDGPLSDVEQIKIESNYLRGTLAETIAAPLTAGIPDEDNRLMKFHGSYMQDDRDVRNERQKQKLEPAYQFMVRVRAPGGVITSKQYISMHNIAQKYGNGTLRLTTRQAIQIHGILKWNMKKSIRKINDSLLDTFAACGDVNRNVMCNPNPYQSDVHGEVYEWSKRISEHLTPRTHAYHEIWLDGEKVASDTQSDKETEPIYGPVYLPRKFKIGVAVPPSNDVDVFSQDLGFIAILQDEQLQGFNVVAGGGMGMTHGDTNTYPQLGRIIGFCLPNQVIDVAEKIVTIQRDYGNRSVRKNARFKYTIDARGVEWLTDELNERLGWELQPARSVEFEHNGDRYGWVKGTNKKWNFTLFIENGRIKDRDNYKLMTGLLEIAKIHKGDFRLTPNQNLLIGNIEGKDKAQVEELIKKYGLTDGKQYSALRRNAMACVALPTCGLAMAESERYLPSLLDKIEEILEEAGLREEEIVIRMSGCPNGCSRAALGEIGFIGKAPGKYNFYLGAGFSGNRLNKLYRENIGENEILEELKPIIHHYAKERVERERFGDFVIRAGYVKPVHSGLDFHD